MEGRLHGAVPEKGASWKPPLCALRQGERPRLAVGLLPVGEQ